MISVAVGLFGMAASTIAGATAAGAASTTTSQPTTHSYPDLTMNSTFGDVLAKPAFAGFSTDMDLSQNPSQVKAMRVAQRPRFA